MEWWVGLIASCKGIRNFCLWNPKSLKKNCLWNPKSWALESGTPQTIAIRNPSSTDKDWDPVPGIRNFTAWNAESNTVLRSLTYNSCTGEISSEARTRVELKVNLSTKRPCNFFADCLQTGPLKILNVLDFLKTRLLSWRMVKFSNSRQQNTISRPKGLGALEAYHVRVYREI